MAASPQRLARTALLGALAALASSCSEPSGWIAALRGSSDPPPPQVAAPPPAPAGGPAAAPRPAVPDGLPVESARRYAGGRPIGWWSERLVRLRRDGPQDLYRLTLERARLNGLEVVEEDGGGIQVAVATAKVEARP